MSTIYFVVPISVIRMSVYVPWFMTVVNIYFCFVYIRGKQYCHSRQKQDNYSQYVCSEIENNEFNSKSSLKEAFVEKIDQNLC